MRHLTTLGHRNLLYLYETFDATMGFSSHNRVTGFLEACSELDGVTGQTMDMQAGDDPVDAALTALADDERQIVLLHAVTGWKHREIAGLLELPLSTVLSKYRRALLKLKTKLEGGDAL